MEESMITAVNNRRSIRRYKNQNVPRQMIEEIIEAGILAPSSKNRQPWKFIVTSGAAKKEALAVMERGLHREKETPLLPGCTQYIGGAENTLRIMEQAPIVIFIVNTLGLAIHSVLTPEERIYEMCNAQSIGAAIENMCLAAEEQGLGSLWICDTCFAYEELNHWLGSEGELFAALALGYADEQPAARPRKGIEEVTEWRAD